MAQAAARIGASLEAFWLAARNPALLRATIAFVIFNAAELGEWTAILVYAYAATGPASVGLVAVLLLVPAAVLAPLTSGVGDRYRRDRVLLTAYLLQAILIGATGATILANAGAAVVYALAILVSVSQTVPRPVQGALLPELAAVPGELIAANSLASVAEGVGALVGPLAVGAVLAVSTVGTAFVVGSACLLVAVALVARLPAPRSGDRAPAEGARDDQEHDGAALAGTATVDAPPSESLLEGLRTVGRDRDLALVMALMAGRLLVYGGLEVLLVLMAIELLGTGQSGAGYMTASFGAGIVLGGISTIALAGRRRLAPWLGVGAIVVGVQLLLIGLAPSRDSALLLLALGGIGMSIIDVAGQTLLQRIAPDAVRARVFGVLEGLLLAAEALGSLLVAPAVVVLGVRGALIAFGTALPLVALLVAPRFARIDARVVIPEREIDVLRGVSIFAPVSAPVLESAARRLVHLELPAGTIVIREGDPGDRFYVMVAGTVRVTQAGRTLRDMTAGDSFGEIALLRDVPRTATVTAVTAVELYALDREQFLAAVTGQPHAIAEALRVAAARLAGAGG
jgi:MFS family permease